LAASLIAEAGGEPLFKWYPSYVPGEGFPAVTCISVNEEIVHGIPGDRVLEPGDAVSIDCGVRLKGWCADSAITISVPGGDRPAVRELLDTTDELLRVAIDLMEPGRPWSKIARVMEQMAEDGGYGIIREYVGHGIGRQMHESPKVPNFVPADMKSQDFVLRPGLVLAVEPMLALGTGDTRALDDGWTVVTRDGLPAAHAEHTVAVSDDGAVVLTQRPRG
ncbi:MAG: type I methionyl aminopeptidase, partial [Planctomycetota bacterium]